MIILDDNILYETIKVRSAHSYKGDYGHVLLIGGNQQYGGAIIMAAQACLNSGAGLITVATQRCNQQALHARAPEIMAIDYEDTALVSSLLHKADVILIGCGLGLDEQALSLLKLTLKEISAAQFLIIDGSALALCAQYHLPYTEHSKTIITPHQQEWCRLSQIALTAQNIETNFAKAKTLNIDAVLKSEQTQIILHNENESFIINNGTPAMATGGTGDTLAGMIAGFTAQFKNKKALLAATYLHSKIAHDLALTNYVVLPTTISANIPRYMKQFEQQ